MDWSYRPERRASIEDIAQSIHDAVTMDDVLSTYSPSTPRRGRRCPCPIHNGQDYNFSYTQHGYKCFVCGASGDVIAFVKEVCELSTRADAMRRINTDLRLGLPIDGNVSEIQSASLALRRAEAEARRAAEDAWWDEYHRLMDMWVECDIAKRTAAPESDEYADAVKNIDFIEFQIGMLEVSKQSST